MALAPTDDNLSSDNTFKKILACIARITLVFEVLVFSSYFTVIDQCCGCFLPRVSG